METMKENEATELEAPAVVAGLVERRVMRPGQGWRHVAGAVYERKDLVRIHLLGMCRLADNTWVSGSRWPESREMERAIRINGGNRKRGMMAWANRLAEYNVELTGRGAPAGDGTDAASPRSG